MFAVIETGGKQYIVAPKQKLRVEKLAGEAGDTVTFDKVLLVADDSTASVGAPYLKGAAVEAAITQQTRNKKIRILRYHSKTRRRRRKGHRQSVTEIEIKAIKK